MHPLARRRIHRAMKLSPVFLGILPTQWSVPFYWWDSAQLTTICGLPRKQQPHWDMCPGPEQQTALTRESGDGGCPHWFYTSHTASATWGIWKLSWCQFNMKQPPPWTVECLPARRALACQVILDETWRLWEPSQTGDQGKHGPKTQIR